MAILNPAILPTLGLPTEVVAPQRQKKMTQADFYRQQRQPQPTAPQPVANPMAAVDNTVQPQAPQFQQDPMTGDFIKKQLASYAQRQAIPQIEPGARVKAPDQSLVDPSNFQELYDRLGVTAQLGDDMLGAASARAAFSKQQSLNAVLSKSAAAPGTATLNGNNYGSGVPSNPKANFSFAQQIAPQYGWDANQLSAWYTLGMKESGWNSNAQNPTSTAYGIGQFLNSTWAGVGATKTSDPQAQVAAMAKYIKNRYGTPSAALAFHIAHNWY